LANLTLKEFITKLDSHLAACSHDELKEIVRAWAMDLAPGERAGFLSSFESQKMSRHKKSGKGPKKIDSEALLTAIHDFGRRAANYEFSTGWGYDHAMGFERAWGDNAWVEIIDDLFDRIDECYQAGDYTVAHEAYKDILRIFLEGEEEGQFSGYQHEDMIAADLNEICMKYLRSVYHSEEASTRPSGLLEAIREFWYLSPESIIHGMINVSLEDLPDFERFKTDWVQYLKRQPDDREVTPLLKEAVRLFQGMKGLEVLALDEWKQFPGAFVEWIEALEKTGNYSEVIRAARLGLDTLPDCLAIRAAVADYLLAAARQMGNSELIGESLETGLHADPSLPRVLELLDQSGSRKQKVRYLDRALERFEAIDSRRKESREDHEAFRERSLDWRKNNVPDNLKTYCRLLRGDYTEVVDTMNTSKVLGWSSDRLPHGIIVPLILKARWGSEKQLLGNMERLWLGMTARLWYDRFDEESEDLDYDQMFREQLDEVLKEVPIPGADLERYFAVVERAVLARADAIVGGKHRKSYWKAAQLLLALAEVYWSNDQAAKGQMIVNQYRENYSRHSAFKSKLREAADLSKIFSVS